MPFGIKKVQKKTVLKEKKPKTVSKDLKKIMVCVSCKRLNQKSKIKDGLCLTCKRMNRKQKLLKK